MKNDPSTRRHDAMTFPQRQIGADREGGSGLVGASMLISILATMAILKSLLSTRYVNKKIAPTRKIC